MAWVSFTAQAAQVVSNAKNEARAWGAHFVSDEHLLLGLFPDGMDSVAARVLERMGLQPGVVRAEMQRQMARGTAGPNQGKVLSATAKRTIDLAYDEARQPNVNYIGTEHLLLGLIAEEHGLAGRVMRQSGASLERARMEVERLQNGGSVPGNSMQDGVN